MRAQLIYDRAMNSERGKWGGRWGRGQVGLGDHQSGGRRSASGCWKTGPHVEMRN